MDKLLASTLAYILLASCAGAAFGADGSSRNMPTVAVLILSEGQVPLSEIYGTTRASLEAHTALRIAPLEAIGFEAKEALRRCAGKPACFAEKLTSTSLTFDWLLSVSLDRSDAEMLVGLRLIDLERETELGAAGEIIQAPSLSTDSMSQVLGKVIPQNLWEQVAALVVESDPSGAEVHVANERCVSPCRLKRLLPGLYRVEVFSGGKKAFEQEVSLLAGREERIRADLSEESAPIHESPWFWAAIGAGIIAVGVTGFVLLQDQEREVNLCFPDGC